MFGWVTAQRTTKSESEFVMSFMSLVRADWLINRSDSVREIDVFSERRQRLFAKSVCICCCWELSVKG